MEEGKHASSQTLSDGNDRLEEENDDDLGTQRAYQCMFCKRGFTNAQALGGHMNIHRKQRPKAKHSSSVDSAFDSKTYEELFSSGYLAHEKTNHHSAFQVDKRSYQMYYERPSQPNPRYPPVSYSFEHNFFAAAPRPAQPLMIRSIDHNCFTAIAERPQPLIRGLDQERVGENLSLGIGHNRSDEKQEGVGVKGEEEVDLELRLACHTC